MPLCFSCKHLGATSFKQSSVLRLQALPVTAHSRISNRCHFAPDICTVEAIEFCGFCVCARCARLPNTPRIIQLSITGLASATNSGCASRYSRARALISLASTSASRMRSRLSSSLTAPRASCKRQRHCRHRHLLGYWQCHVCLLRSLVTTQAHSIRSSSDLKIKSASRQIYLVTFTVVVVEFVL